MDARCYINPTSDLDALRVYADELGPDVKRMTSQVIHDARVVPNTMIVVIDGGLLDAPAVT